MPNELQKTILIVEDEPSQLNVMADELADHGFRVLQATNGRQGLQLALHEQPDVILLDIMMPVMGGITMMRMLRKLNAWGARVPILILTNLIPNDEQRMGTVRQDEYVSYLVKSIWPLSHIVEKVKEQLATHKPQPSKMPQPPAP